MYEINERIVRQYVVTCPDGEVTFEEEDMAKAFVQLHELAKPLTIEEVEGTPEQIVAWCAIGSCPNCGAMGDELEIEHLDGDSYAAECCVCGTRFGIYDGKSEAV